MEVWKVNVAGRSESNKKYDQAMLLNSLIRWTKNIDYFLSSARVGNKVTNSDTQANKKFKETMYDLVTKFFDWTKNESG